MTPENFCYWLQGYFELKQTIDHRDGATPETMKMIEDHLKEVFKKETPQFDPTPGIRYLGDRQPYAPGSPFYNPGLVSC